MSFLQYLQNLEKFYDSEGNIILFDNEVWKSSELAILSFFFRFIVDVINSSKMSVIVILNE